MLAQTLGDLELIVVDDAGPLPAAETLAGIGDPRLRVVRRPRNRGTAAARNLGLKLARAPLVAPLDGDDAWEPRYLERIIPVFENPSIGLAYANVRIVGHPHGHEDYIGDPRPHPIDTFPAIASACPVPAPAVTMRADAVRAAGGWAEWLWTATDYLLYLELAAAGWRFAYVHEFLARYSWPVSSRSKSHARARVERAELVMWLWFCLRHPQLRGPRRQIRHRLTHPRQIVSPRE